MPSSSKSEAPGLQRRRNKDGTSRAYWHAPTYIKKLGYEPTQVRLDDALPEAQWAAECRRLHEEMLTWTVGRRSKLSYNGTVGSLWEWYESADDSPYRNLKPGTAQGYRTAIKPLLLSKSALLVEDVTGAQVRRWFDELQLPGADGRQRSVGYVAFTIKVFKAMLAFGSSHRKEECTKLRLELNDTRFKSAEARETQFTYEDLVAFREAAFACERPSMALAVTLQFELGMRQKDVIGEWIRAPGTDGIRDRAGRRWVNGLTGLHFDDAGRLRKRTTKTGAKVEHALDDYPELASMIRPLLELDRGGPLVVSERTRQPYLANSYRVLFRRIAREAMIPDSVWNMDARAGAVTESYEAGATTEEAMALAGHTQAKTSRRYLRSVARQSSSVARKRVQARGGNE
jgi:hypothetical protein